jgi:hypothetical protein
MSCENKEGCCRYSYDDQSDPNCVGCLRKELDAVGVAVFFKEDSGWRISDYQSDKPEEDAEIEAVCMLRGGVPEAALALGASFRLTTASAVADAFPDAKGLFDGSTVVGVQIEIDGRHGLRIAWRDISEPFTDDEIESAKCPKLCIKRDS